MNHRILAPISIALLLPLAGCLGGNDVTRDGANAASERISMLKAGTEWQMAQQAFLAGDLDKALKKVDSSLEINDTVTKSYVLRGRVLMEMGRMGEALTALMLAESYGPEDSEALYYLAMCYERLGETQDAHDAFVRASENDDMNPGYAVAAAEMLIEMERLDEARVFLQSTPTFEHHAGVRQTLGHIAMMQQEPAVAVRFFEEAQMLAPEDSQVQQDKIFALVEAGRFADAEADLHLLLAQDEYEDRRDLLHLRARCLVELSRPVEARTVFQKLTEGGEGADDVDAWIGLGNSAYLVSDDRSLRRAAGRVITMAPSQPDGHTLMALYHRRLGALEDALASIEQALDHDSQDASTHAFRGLILADLGEMIKSIEAFRIATELEPTNPDYQAMLEWASLGDFATVPTDSE